MNFFMKNAWYFSGLLLLLQACANPIAPTGGPVDEQPPRIDSSRSTPNLQTNFSQRYFELTFDEWVVLEDLSSQVIVSPPIDYEITLKRRTVRFEIDQGDSLRANTTYTINFGDAVQDLTEKNPAEDLRFVFSTGPALDSLSISGQLYDVKTREAVEEAFFMLYESRADSVVRTLRPYYFGKTDEQGDFTIQNVRAGTYKAFALKDGDLNYLFNSYSEAIGFPDSAIVIAPGQEPSLRLPLFEEEPPLRFVNHVDSRYGRVGILFNRPPPEDIRLQLPGDLALDTLTERIGDTLKLWYSGDPPPNWTILLSRDTSLRDTVRVRTPDRSAFFQQGRLQLEQPKNESTVTLPPRTYLELEWNHPLADFDSTRVVLRRDTVRLPSPQLAIDSTQGRLLQLQMALQQDSSYQLQILPGAIADVFGFLNDSVSLTIRAGNVEDYGNIIVSLTELDSTRNYRIELLRGEDIVADFYSRRQAEYQFRKDLLRPGRYDVRIIEDRNENGRWDTGNYDLRRQPEPIYTRELDQLRANWDLEVSISLPDLFQIRTEE